MNIYSRDRLEFFNCIISIGLDTFNWFNAAYKEVFLNKDYYLSKIKILQLSERYLKLKMFKIYSIE